MKLEESFLDRFEENYPDFVQKINSDGTISQGYDSGADFFTERIESLSKNLEYLIKYVDENTLSIVKERRVSSVLFMMSKLRKELDEMDYVMRIVFPSDVNHDNYESYLPGFSLRAGLVDYYKRMDESSNKLLHFVEIESFTTGQDYFPRDYCSPKYRNLFNSNEEYSYANDMGAFTFNSNYEYNDVNECNTLFDKDLLNTIQRINNRVSIVCLMYFYNEKDINESNVKELCQQFKLKTESHLLGKYRDCCKDSSRYKLCKFLEKTDTVKKYLTEKGKKKMKIDIKKYFEDMNSNR